MLLLQIKASDTHGNPLMKSIKPYLKAAAISISGQVMLCDINLRKAGSLLSVSGLSS